MPVPIDGRQVLAPLAVHVQLDRNGLPTTNVDSPSA